MRLYHGRMNPVNYCVPGPCSLEEVVIAICEHAQEGIPVDALSPELRFPILPRGKVIYRYAWDAIDDIASNYLHLYWWVSDRGLRMETIRPPVPPADFDHVAGKLMFEVRQRSPERSRLSAEDYAEIAMKLDEGRSFRLIDVISKNFRKQLADWNQKHPNKAIKSFLQAIDAKQPPDMVRQLKKRLYRAHESYISQEENLRRSNS